jgi:hypothetical protein
MWRIPLKDLRLPKPRKSENDDGSFYALPGSFMVAKSDFRTSCRPEQLPNPPERDGIGKRMVSCYHITACLTLHMAQQKYCILRNRPCVDTALVLRWFRT